MTFASNKDDKDIWSDLVDVVSWNVYAGWYFRRPKLAYDAVKPRMHEAIERWDGPSRRK